MAHSLAQTPICLLLAQVFKPKLKTGQEVRGMWPQTW